MRAGPVQHEDVAGLRLDPPRQLCPPSGLFVPAAAKIQTADSPEAIGLRLDRHEGGGVL
jgi:hypothetical protein